MTAPKPNADLAYRVLDHIDANPDSWNQRWWFTKTDCGTAACFAGWACLLSGDKPDLTNPDDDVVEDHEYSFVELPDGSKAHVETRAAELLGIGQGPANNLFDAVNDREDLGCVVAAHFGPRPAPTVRFGIAVDDDNGHHVRFRLFAATGGQHLGGCGQLTMRTDEYAAFRALLEPALTDRSDAPGGDPA